MTAFDHAWDLLKALNPMPGEEGLPEEELRHYLNYMRQKENFTPQGRKKPQEPQVMGEGATVSDTAAPSFESTLQNLPVSKLERLAYEMNRKYDNDIEKAAIEKAFAVLKNMGGAAGYAKCPSCNQIGPGREEECERCKAQQSVGEGAAVADTRMRRAE